VLKIEHKMHQNVHSRRSTAAGWRWRIHQITHFHKCTAAGCTQNRAQNASKCSFPKKYRSRVTIKYRLMVVVACNRDSKILRFHLQLNHAVAA
jgi:hypothetical protein